MLHDGGGKRLYPRDDAAQVSGSRVVSPVVLSYCNFVEALADSYGWTFRALMVMPRCAAVHCATLLSRCGVGILGLGRLVGDGITALP
jgi:hypothetical protein